MGKYLKDCCVQKSVRQVSLLRCTQGKSERKTQMPSLRIYMRLPCMVICVERKWMCSGKNG